MRSRKTGLLLAASLACGNAQGDGGGARFQASLRGVEVVPQGTAGKVGFRFAPDFSRLAYRLRLRHGGGLGPARLHCAPAGTTGPVVAELLGPVAGGWHGALDIRANLDEARIAGGADCLAAIGRAVVTLADLAAAMAAGGIYVAVATARFPEGELRGQVRGAPPVAKPPPATAAPVVTPSRRAKIFVGSTPVFRPPWGGTFAVPLGFTAPYPWAGLPGGGGWAVSVAANSFSIPLQALDAVSRARTTRLLVEIPAIGFSIPPTGFAAPNFGFGLPASAFRFEPALNPPRYSSGFAIPATTMTFPALIQPAAPYPAIPATATFSFPAASFAAGTSFPGAWRGGLSISLR